MMTDNQAERDWDSWHITYEDFFDAPKRTTRWTRFKGWLGL